MTDVAVTDQPLVASLLTLGVHRVQEQETVQRHVVALSLLCCTHFQVKHFSTTIQHLNTMIANRTRLRLALPKHKNLDLLILACYMYSTLMDSTLLILQLLSMKCAQTKGLQGEFVPKTIYNIANKSQTAMELLSRTDWI